MQSLEGHKKGIYLALREEQTHPHRWWQFTQAALTSLQLQAVDNLPVYKYVRA